MSETIDVIGGDYQVFPNDTLSQIFKESGRPEPYKVWGYGILLVTGINLCSLLGVVVNPLSKRKHYRILLLFLVSIAVGVLAGSSLLFLLSGVS